jgi:hypothetical protein
LPDAVGLFYKPMWQFETALRNKDIGVLPEQWRKRHHPSTAKRCKLATNQGALIDGDDKARGLAVPFHGFRGREHRESRNLTMPKIAIVVGKGQRLNSRLAQPGQNALAQRPRAK